MLLVYISSGIMAFLIFAVLLTAYICFARVFLSDRRKNKPAGFELPPGEEYEPFRPVMKGWYNQLSGLEYTPVSIKSHDNLTLRGRYYEIEKGAPVELMFHGYRGNSVRDLSGGVFRAFSLGHNVIIIDHRGSGDSDGRVITFGINECRDCLGWIEFALSYFGNDVRLILTGISMGAATVVMASSREIPENVRYVLADCPYSSQREIIKSVIAKMGLPGDILYPFVKLGGRIFGNFDLEEQFPIEAAAKSRVPIIFFHGDADDFVPFHMSERLYEACCSEKKLVCVKGAGHGLAYPVDREGYLDSLREFDRRYL